MDFLHVIEGGLMKLTIEHYDEEFTWDFPEVTATEVLHRLCQAMIVMGFQQGSIDQAILNLAEEIEGKLERKSQEIMKETTESGK